MSMWKHCYDCKYTQHSYPADINIYCSSCDGEMVVWTAPSPSRSHTTTPRDSYPSWRNGGRLLHPTREPPPPPPPPPRQIQTVSPTSTAASLFVDGLMSSLTLYDRENTQRITDYSSSDPSIDYSDDEDVGNGIHNDQDDSVEGDYDEEENEDNGDDDDDDNEGDDEDEENEINIEQPSRIPEYWDDETESNILEGEIRPKVFTGHRCRQRYCGREHPTEMHSVMWNFQEVWTPKHSKGAASRIFCVFCMGRRGPDAHSHTTEDHNKGEWRDHPEVNFGNYTQSRRYADFANPWYQFRTAKRPFPLCYYDPVNFPVPEEYPVLLGINNIHSGLWYGASNSVETLQDSLERVLRSEAYVDANQN